MAYYVGQVLSDVPYARPVFFGCLTLKMKALQFFKRVVQRNTATSQNICIFSNIAVRTLNLVCGQFHFHFAGRRNRLLDRDCMAIPKALWLVPRKYHPPVLRHHRLATALAALQVLLGIAVTSLAVWLLVWAPNLRVRDIPYWSGLPLLLSGIMGLLLLCCCHKDYPGMPLGVWMFSVKVTSVCFAVVAGVTCFCACVFALLHLIFLTSMTCEPAHVLNATCICQDVQRTYHYTDLNCPEVGNILTILLIGSCATNSIGGVLATWYVFLHWSSRYSYLYSEVKTSDNKPIVFSNKLDTHK